MDLNKNIDLVVQSNKSKKENYIVEKNNEIRKENSTNNNNISQSNESVKTTEYSSESGEVISKYLIKTFKNNINITNKENIKNYTNQKNVISNDNQSDNKKNGINLNKNKNKKALKFQEYNSDYLSYKNANINAPKIPFIFNFEFQFSTLTNQGKIGEKEYIHSNLENIFNKCEEYTKISTMPHDKLLHLCVNENSLINKNEKNYNKLSVTQRNKHKFLTIIYISPKKS